MAFSIVKSQKAVWKAKSAIKSKPTLGISHQALSEFSIPTLKIWNVSVTSFIEDHYGRTDIEDLQVKLQSVTPPMQPLMETTLPELLRVLTGIFLIYIKREFTTTERVDHDRDYLMCIEVFASALDTLPKNDELAQVTKLISWDTITCEPLNIKFETPLQFQQFIQLAQLYGLTHDHELCKLDSASELSYRDANKLISKTLINPALFKAGIIHNAIQNQSSLPNCYGGLLFLLAFGFSR